MKIIYAKHFPPKGYKAITLGSVIIVRKPNHLDTTDYNHECIHWEQYKELLIVFFWVLYVLNFIFNMFRYKFNWHTAYKNICFENEAYYNQFDIDYITNRKHYSWIKYI